MYIRRQHLYHEQFLFYPQKSVPKIPIFYPSLGIYLFQYIHAHAVINLQRLVVILLYPQALLTLQAQHVA